jgi:hypothetical protein
VDAGGRLDCGVAAVTVVVQAAGPPTSGPGGTSGGAGGQGPAGPGQSTPTVPTTGPNGPPTSGPAPPIDPAPAAAPIPYRWLGLALLGAVLAALTAVAWRAERTRRQRAWTRQHIRGEPHPGPARTAVEVDARAAPAPEVRLEPHPDPGVQHLEEGIP